MQISLSDLYLIELRSVRIYTGVELGVQPARLGTSVTDGLEA